MPQKPRLGKHSSRTRRFRGLLLLLAVACAGLCGRLLWQWPKAEHWDALCHHRPSVLLEPNAFANLAICIVTCTSDNRHYCDDPKRHVALVESQLRTWAADALRFGANVLIASDAPWPAWATPLPASVDYQWFSVPKPSCLRLGFERGRPREGVFRPESNRTRQVLGYAWKELPSTIQFFLKIDDDAYLRPHRIFPLLQHLDPARPLYLGSVRTFWGALDPVHAEAANASQDRRAAPSILEYAMGGAGYVLSRALVATLVSRFQSCRLYNGEDKDLAACVRACPDAEILNVAGFWYGPPETAPPQQRDSMISFHKLNRAADMVRIHKSFGMHANCARVDSGGDFV